MGTKMKDLSGVLFPGTRRKILALFFLNSDKEYYFSEVVRLTGTRQGVIQRELKSLTEAEILTSEQRGRQKYYTANRKHPIFQDLRNIIFKTYGVIGKIRDALEPVKAQINIAFVYGSFARGEEVSGSDLDLFVVGNIQLDDLVSALSNVEQAIRREINPTLFSAREFKNKWSRNNHFLESVAKTEKDYVIGSEDEFRRLAE